MSYTPTNWASTDVVTASRMNALEQAVGDMNMSYTPNVWQDGDVLTASKMNALEQAVASGGGGSDFSTAEITVVFSGNAPEDIVANGEFVITPSETSAEYHSAYYSTNTAFVILLYQGESTVYGVDAFSESESMWYVDGDNATISWSGNVNTDGESVVITGDCVCTITIL